MTLTSWASPLAGASVAQFGFEVPPGDPGAIDQAANACRALAGAMRAQASALRSAGEVALGSGGGWRGSAASTFADYAGHVTSVVSGNAAACDEAAGSLSALSTELATAQRITRQALSDCERYQREMLDQQRIAGQAAQEAQNAAKLAAMNPHLASSFSQAISTAQHQAGQAKQAAAAAQINLEAAQQRGRTAAEQYAHQAQAAGRRLVAAADQIRPVPAPAGGAVPVPIAVTPADMRLASLTFSSALPFAAYRRAMANPAELRALLCGEPVSPAMALLFLGAYGTAQQRAEQEARPHSESVFGWIWHHTAGAVAGAAESAGKFVYDNSGTISAVAGFAAMIPVVDTVAAPVAIVTGGISTGKDVAHGDYAGAVVDGVSTIAGVGAIDAKVEMKSYEALQGRLWNRGYLKPLAEGRAQEWKLRMRYASGVGLITGSVISPAHSYAQPHHHHK
jgi:hypothetical protein